MCVLSFKYRQSEHTGQYGYDKVNKKNCKINSYTPISNLKEKILQHVAVPEK